LERAMVVIACRRAPTKSGRAIRALVGAGLPATRFAWDSSRAGALLRKAVGPSGLL
jgi:hypothetical protein